MFQPVGTKDDKNIVKTPVNAATNEVIDVTRTLINETYNSSVQSLNTGFALASALAWNDTVKVIIKKYIKSASITQWHLIYAFAVTVLSAIVFVMTKRFLKPSMTKKSIQPVFAAM